MTGANMARTHILDSIFRGKHVTLVLKISEPLPDIDGESAQGFMVAEGIFADSDSEFIYLSENLDYGITEAVATSLVARVMATDSISAIDNSPTDRSKFN